jgi:hypothetical protein
MKYDNYFDKFGWLIEGLIPLIIPFILLIFFQRINLYHAIGFSGSLALVQLIPTFVKYGLSNKNILFRLDNIIRFLILISVLAYYIFLGIYFTIFWVILILCISILFFKFKYIGRLRVSIFSIFGRLINYTYIISIIFDDNLGLLRFLNGFLIY